MNVSIVSTYDNVSYNSNNTSKSSVYRALSDLLDVNDEAEVTMFCPLCVNAFRYKFTLFEHLKTHHLNFFLNVKNKIITYDECPFCKAKFYEEYLVAKHCLLEHLNDITELFVDKNFKCNYCDKNHNNVDFNEVVRHVEESHYAEFELKFKRKYLSSVTTMHFSSFLNSNSGSFKSFRLSDYLDIDFIDKNNMNENNQLPQFPTIPRQVNNNDCFDFTDLCKHLPDVKHTEDFCCKNKKFKRKSLLKNITNHSINSGVRRGLRFDCPNYSCDNKENTVLKQNMGAVKEVSIEEHSLLCEDDKFNISDVLNNISGDWFNKPLLSSTPNTKLSRVKSQRDSNMASENQINFKSYVCNYKNYEFKCGKCKKMFNENMDLVYHVKNTHKRIDLKVFKPCYKCGICNAKFYRNNYLKKHHKLHKPY